MRQRLAAAGLVALGGAVISVACNGSSDWGISGSPKIGVKDPVGIGEGWTRLPDAPRIGEGAGLVYGDDRLLLWGGCKSDTPDISCRPSRAGDVFHPGSMTWTPLPKAPIGLEVAAAVWTGDEAIFLSRRGVSVAFDPGSSRWRRLADAPLGSLSNGPFAQFASWTGSELFVWGFGSRWEPVAAGALYDPVADDWRQTAEAPIELNQGNSVWTGREVVAYGSLLDRGNSAAEPRALGAAYNPASDTWRELPRSSLSPQSTSLAALRDGIIAWDYAPRSQVQKLGSRPWSSPIRLPFDFSECSSEGGGVDERALAVSCGRFAVSNERGTRWRPLRPRLPECWGEEPVPLGHMVSAGDTAFLFSLGDGLINPPGGERCRLPTSFWAYSPRAGPP